MKTRIRVISGPFKETVYTDEPLDAKAAAVFVLGTYRPKQVGNPTRVVIRGPEGESDTLIQTNEILDELNSMGTYLTDPPPAPTALEPEAKP